MVLEAEMSKSIAPALGWSSAEGLMLLSIWWKAEGKQVCVTHS